MQINTKKVSEWAHKLFTDPLRTDFAWFPTKMTSGKWIWLRKYWYHDPRYPSPELYFKCDEAEKLVLTLQGCIEDEQLSQAFERSLRKRNRETGQDWYR